MSIVDLIEYAKGYVKINISGKYLERFINVCMKRNIHLWDIENTDNNSLNVSVSISGYRKLRQVAYKTRTKVRMLNKSGLPFVLYKFKNRKLFFAGILLMMLFVWYITSLVLVVDIKGNMSVSDELIIETLENHGFKPGVKKSKVDPSKLQNDILLNIDELSWAWIDLSGICATVEVKEKVPIPKIIDKNAPCNIISSKDGVITAISATNGKRVVGVGDVVSKGDLLISGIVGSREAGYKYMHSAGSVKARTWYEKSTNVSLKKDNFVQTNKKIKKNTVNLFGFGVKLYLSKDIPFEYYKSSGNIKRLKLFGNYYMPFSFSTNVYEELSKELIVLNENEAFDIGMKTLQVEMEKEFSDDTAVINIDGFYERIDDDTLRITARYECIEEISTLIELKDVEQNITEDPQGE